jgi:hypothetical protein
MGFDCLKERRSLFAVREGERRIRRSDPMEMLEGGSEWAGSRRKSCKPQKILVEVFLTGRPLSICGEVHVDLSRRPGEAVSYANSGGHPTSLPRNPWRSLPAEQMEAGSKRKRVVPR